MANMGYCDVLEGVGLGLPASVELDPHLDAAVNHLFSALEIDPQLYEVTVVDRKMF